MLSASELSRRYETPYIHLLDELPDIITHDA
mgnify:FL=1